MRPDFDLYELIPAPTNTPSDAGPYITMGMCYAAHPDTGAHDVTIHRMCIQSRDELSIYFVPGARHIGAMAERAEALGQPLPISISIGVDPAVEIGACFEPPTTSMGFDELSIAGALRGEPVKLCRCLSVDELAIANAEYVIEGEVVPGARVVEDQNTHTGFAMPEFSGYTGPAFPECCLIKVKAVTHRKNPVMQTCIGPSEEHVSMAGIPTEASIYGMIEKAMPGMIVIPCSMKTIAGIACGYSDNLLLRAADVTLKERRLLVLCIREAPFSTIHLRNMLKLSQMGAVILPAVMSFYGGISTAEDMCRQIVGKALDQLGIENDRVRRWGGAQWYIT